MRISDWSSDVCSSDLARPAVLVRLAGLRERRAVALGDVLVVEDEVEQEHAAQVGAAEVEARSHHADLVAHLQAVAAGEEVGLLAVAGQGIGEGVVRSEEHTSELQSLMRITSAVLCL